MSKSFFFYGIYDGNEGDDTWRALHEHFERLAKDEKVVESVITDRKAKEGVRE